MSRESRLVKKFNSQSVPKGTEIILPNTSNVNMVARKDGTYFSTFTTGSVLFVNAQGLLGEANASLFWDNTNKRLGIGTAAPETAVDVKKQVRCSSIVMDGDESGGAGTITVSNVYSEAVSTGVARALCLGATNQNSSGWMKIYVNGNVRYIPYWTTITG